MQEQQRQNLLSRAGELHQQLMQAFQEVEDPLETDRLGELLVQWNNLISELESITEEDYSSELQTLLSQLYSWNQEIGAAASSLRDGLAKQISDRVKGKNSVNTYKAISGQR